MFPPPLNRISALLSGSSIASTALANYQFGLEITATGGCNCCFY